MHGASPAEHLQDASHCKDHFIGRLGSFQTKMFSVSVFCHVRVRLF